MAEKIIEEIAPEEIAPIVEEIIEEVAPIVEEAVEEVVEEVTPIVLEEVEEVVDENINKKEFNNSINVSKNSLHLPSSTLLKENEIKFICNKVKLFFSKNS